MTVLTQFLKKVCSLYASLLNGIKKQHSKKTLDLLSDFFLFILAIVIVPKNQEQISINEIEHGGTFYLKDFLAKYYQRTKGISCKVRETCVHSFSQKAEGKWPSRIIAICTRQMVPAAFQRAGLFCSLENKSHPWGTITSHSCASMFYQENFTSLSQAFAVYFGSYSRASLALTCRLRMMIGDYHWFYIKKTTVHKSPG